VARAFDNVIALFDKAGIQDSDVESSEVFLHTAGEGLDGHVGTHLKLPHLDLGAEKLSTELGGSVLTFLD